MLDLLNRWILVPETSLAWALVQVGLWYGPVVIAVGLLLVCFGPDTWIRWRAQRRRRSNVVHFPPVPERRVSEWRSDGNASACLSAIRPKTPQMSREGTRA